MKHLYFLLALALTASHARAQDAHTQDTRTRDSLQTGISPDSAIHATLVQGYKYPHLVYTANGEEVGQRDIIRRLEAYPETFDQLRQYHDAKTGTYIWLGLMLSSAVGAGVEKGQNNQGGAYAFAGVFLSAMVGEFVSAAKAQRHLRQAIRIYNKRFVP